MPLREENKIDWKEDGDGMSTGQEKAGLRKALWKGRPEGLHSQALLFHDFVPSCFTSPLSVPSLAAKTGAQPET